MHEQQCSYMSKPCGWGSVPPSILRYISLYYSSEFSKCESNTPSDWLNHLVWPISKWFSQSVSGLVNQ